MAHYVIDTNLVGAPVAHRFVKRIRNDVWEVRMDTFVDGVCADTNFWPLDTIAGRDKLARYCVSPDMLTEGK